MRRRLRLEHIAAAIALLLGARATECDAQSLRRSTSVVTENDNFEFWRPPEKRTDDNYTQGLRIHADADGMPTPLLTRFCPMTFACGSSLEIGQDMYTPTHDAVKLRPGERPYAGWLYLQGTAEAASVTQRRTLSATVGVTGPLSLAGQAQMTFHHLMGHMRKPLGWSGQLPSEPDFAVQGEMDRYVTLPALARWIDLTPEAHMTLGTLRTAIGAGSRARAGVNLTHPWMRDPRASLIELYVFVGGQGELVARDLFLDGTTFRSSPHVSLERRVRQWERGVGARLGRLGLEFRGVTTTRDYVTGPPSHSFGGFTITFDADP